MKTKSFWCERRDLKAVNALFHANFQALDFVVFHRHFTENHSVCQVTKAVLCRVGVATNKIIFLLEKLLFKH